jgi:hypothetical protein
VTSTKETFIPRVTKEEDVLLQSVLFSTLSRRFTIKWQKLLPSTDMYKIEAMKTLQMCFLIMLLQQRRLDLTEVSAKVQELRMAECKPLKRTDAVRLVEPPSNLKYEVEETCTGGLVV